MHSSTRTKTTGTFLIGKLFLVTVLIASSASFVRSQSPGGVSTSLTAWLKANTSIAGNLTIPSTATNKISQWKSEVGTFSVSQATTSYQPSFQPTASTIANFNFNPTVQFNTAATTSIYNSATTPDLLGTTGTIFFVVNNYAGSFGNPTGLTYYSNTSYRYQIKPSFRMQVGSTGSGWTADINATGGPVNTASNESAFILASKSNAANFRGRKNADSVPLTNNADPVYFPAINAGLYLGNDGAGGGGQPFNGAIAEVITYNADLSIADINKVESYLALKYGITLSQTSAYGIANSNYTASDGTQIWNASANSAYGKNIIGIGRDDASVLLQKQTRSVHNNALIYLYNGSTAGTFPAMNTDNSTTITADKSFIIAGDNGSSAALTGCTAGNRIVRMGRVWKAQKTGTGITQVTIAVNTSDVAATIKKLIVSPDPTFASTATTVYTLATGGGKLYATITLNNNDYFTFGSDSLQVTLAATAPSCTNPTSGSIATTVTGGVAPYTYLWTPSAQATANLTNVAAGTYTLTVSQGVCQYTQQAIITPVVLPATPTVNSPTICSGSTAAFTVQNIQTGITYNWYTAATGGTSIATGSSFTSPALTAAATYYVEAVSSTGCISTTRGSGTASLYVPLSQPVVTAPTGTIGVNSIVFNWLPVTGAIGYQVMVNGGTPQVPSSGSTGLTHTVTGLPALTNVTIQVIALGGQACQNSIAGTATAKTLTDEIFIPNVFTPNGDGKNEVFKVYSNVIASMDMMVFNQWGELIYRNKDLSKGWDGTYKGKQQPVGVYVYAIKVKLIGGDEIIRKGDVNLVR